MPIGKSQNQPDAPGMTLDVGHRLRAARKSAGLTQRALAARAGVTNGLISMVEQNRSSPSVASLKRILDAIPITFSDFFADAPVAADKVFFTAGELREISPNRVFGAGKDFSALVSLRQVGDMRQHNLQMLHETYEPGADTGVELYTHDAEEAGIVVEGSIELTVGDSVRELQAGDAYIFDSRRPHRFRNTGTVRCVVVSACTPPSF